MIKHRCPDPLMGARILPPPPTGGVGAPHTGYMVV